MPTRKVSTGREFFFTCIHLHIGALPPCDLGRAQLFAKRRTIYIFICIKYNRSRRERKEVIFNVM